MMPFKVATLTYEQNAAMEVARVGFMSACPFYAHLFYAECKDVPTLDIPTAATDGRTIFYNPVYLAGLTPAERVFVLAHEMDHVLCRHPQRSVTYAREKALGAHPYDHKQLNVAMDYVINAGLLEQGIGMFNPSWCYAGDVSGSDLSEDVYAKKFKKQPDKPSTYGSSGHAPKGTKRDKAADAADGAFDDVLPPPVDPVTGKEDVMDDSTFKEAVARAAAAAKAMGNMPASLQKRVDEILDPQIDWTEYVRTLLTGHMGARHETWNRPNRRRLVLNPMLFLPGRRGYGAELVVVALDTSGSIYAAPKALAAFFAEVGGVLADVRPKRVMLIECDAKVGRVTDANSLDELEYARQQGVTGGGGTAFEPVFNYVAEHDLRPDTLIYLTDLEGSFPRTAPAYPVVWCSIEPGTAPFGDTVHIKV